MTLVTEEEVQQAEADAERAEEVRRAADRRFAKGAGTVRGYDEHEAAIRQAEHARARAGMLRTDFEAQAAARAAHAELAAAAARELAPTVRKLAKSREAAVEALAGAEAAIVQALEAVGAYDGLVRETSQELLRRGLRGGHGEEMCGGLDGSLSAAGERWLPCDGAGAVFAVLASHVKARGGQHWVGNVPQASYAGVSQQAAMRALLERVAAKRG